MTCITMPEEQFRVNIDGKIKESLDAVYERQGTSQKEGTTRLFKWFVALDPELQAMILGQIHGSGRTALIHAIMEKMRGQPENVVAETKNGVTKYAIGPTQEVPPKTPKGRQGSAR
jgi:hypothetical protein